MEVIVISIIVSKRGTIPTGVKDIGDIGNEKKNREHTDYSIAEIDQNTEKSPGDLIRWLVFMA